jgi:hypothetical protein
MNGVNECVNELLLGRLKMGVPEVFWLDAEGSWSKDTDGKTHEISWSVTKMFFGEYSFSVTTSSLLFSKPIVVKTKSDIAELARGFMYDYAD